MTRIFTEDSLKLELANLIIKCERNEVQRQNEFERLIGELNDLKLQLIKEIQLNNKAKGNE